MTVCLLVFEKITVELLIGEHMVNDAVTVHPSPPPNKKNTATLISKKKIKINT